MCFFFLLHCSRWSRFDKWSYSYRDTDGSKFHESRGSAYGDGYGHGDVIGVLLELPYRGNQADSPMVISGISNSFILRFATAAATDFLAFFQFESRHNKGMITQRTCRAIISVL